jgi:hypothetical protein
MCKNCVKLINSIKTVAKDNNKFITKRNRKLNTIDAFVYRLLYSQKYKSQENVVSFMNMHKNIKINRSSYSRKEDAIDLNFYKKIYELICKFGHKYYGKYSKNIISVDGTDVNMDTSLNKNGYKLNKNKESITSLVLGVYNVTKNYPITLELVKHKNERRAFLDFIRGNINEDSIYVFDRGFFSNEVVTKLNLKNIKFVFRLKKNSQLIQKNKNDCISNINNNNNQISLRIVKYTINDNDYYLATNLFDVCEYTIKNLQDIYHFRWSIEEYFKLIKKNMKMSKFNEKDEISIKKSIYCNLILTSLTMLIERCYIKSNKKMNKHQMINKSNLINGMYDHFIINVFYKKIYKRYVEKFIKMYIVIHYSKKGRSFTRTCKTPYHKWYIKRYFKKYIKYDEKNKEKT